MSESILYKMKAKVLFGDTTASMTDVGTINGLSVSTENDNGQLSFDYREDTIDYIKKRIGKIGFELANINWENVKKFSDTDYYTTVAGTLVSDATQTVSDPVKDTFYKIENQNGDGSKVVVDSVGALVLNTDYFVVPDGNGDWGIVFTDNETGDYVITYDYTPSATKVYEYGGGNSVSTITPKVVRVIGTDENGKTLTMTANYAKLTSGIEIAFPAFSADEYAKIPVEFECTADPNDATKPVIKIEAEM